MGLRDAADGIGAVMQQGNLIMLPFVLMDGGIITQLIGLGVTTTGLSIRLAVRLCNTCENFYDSLRGNYMKSSAETSSVRNASTAWKKRHAATDITSRPRRFTTCDLCASIRL